MKEIRNNIINKVHPEGSLLRIYNFLGRCKIMELFSHLINDTNKGDFRTLRAAKHSAMTTLSTNGFTLIELLVVVLIIGILATIALPQYQTAVDKANYSTMMAAVRALKNEQELYYMANGNYTTDWSNMEGVLPGQCNGGNNCGKFVLSMAITNEVGYYVYGYLQKDKVGVGNSFLMYLDHSPSPGKILCSAYLADNERGRKLCATMGTRIGGVNENCAGGCTVYKL